MIPAGNINTVQENILVQEERKYGNHPVRNAPGRYRKEIKQTGSGTGKGKRTIKTLKNSGKFREDVIKFVCFFVIPGNSGKFREIPGNSGKMSSSLSAFLFFPPFLFIFFLFSFKLSSRRTLD